MLSVKITHLHLKTPADTLRSINAAGARNLIEAHFEQSAGHQETPPIALGGLLSAPHPADTLPEHLYSKCATCVHFPLRLSDSFMHIACAGVSPFAAKGVHPPANNKRTIRDVQKSNIPVRVHQTRVNTIPDATSVTEQDPTY